MTRPIANLLSTAALAATLPLSAHAEVSALDVWSSWQAYLENMGSKLEIGRQSTVGDTLRLEDIRLVSPVPEVDMVASLEFLELKERDDGTVQITMAPDLPYSVSAQGEEGDSLDMTMILRQRGLTMVASGEPDNIRYDYLAQSLALDFDKFIVNGEEIEPVITFEMTGLSGSTEVDQRDSWALKGRSTIENMILDAGFEDPESGDKVQMNMTVKDLVTSSETLVPEDFDPEDPAWIWKSGFAARGNMTAGPSAFAMNVSGEENMTLTSTSDSSSLDFELADGRFDYGASNTNNTLGFTSPDSGLPPINVSIGEGVFGLGGTLVPTEEPSDFRLTLKLLQLAVDDFVWMMFDPQGMLPHDPADVIIDASGKMRMTADIFDPEFAETPEDVSAPEIHALDINQILLSLAGARLEGKGGFTFDNSDLTTFDGMPAPSGSLMLDIFGLNALLDTLGNMGLLPQEQAMGFRMMLGAFARPGDGPDHLVSEIEVRGDGSVLANGQQLR